MSAPIVTVERMRPFRWTWEAWHRGPGGSGPVLRGTALTKRRAQRAAAAPVAWCKVVNR